MTPSNYVFWTCPNCRHVRELDMDRMTNRCERIDQGESPVAGAAWEYQDHDRCPAFEPEADPSAPALISERQSIRNR
jgi:hypothetical protein